MLQTYTVEELVPILKRKEKTIRGYINNQELKASWIGNGYVILEEDVKEYLKDNQLFNYDEEDEDEESDDEE